MLFWIIDLACIEISRVIGYALLSALTAK